MGQAAAFIFCHHCREPFDVADMTKVLVAGRPPFDQKKFDAYVCKTCKLRGETVDTGDPKPE